MLIKDQKAFFLKWGILLCMFSLTFLLLYLHTKHFVFWSIFTSRDIFRSLGWLEGQFHWSGPEMTGGQSLPGPFFYFLMFPSLIFGENIYSQTLLWYIRWLSLSYTLAFSFARKIIKHKESLLIFLIAFIASIGSGLFLPLTYYGWNPGFAIFFHISALIGLYYWMETRKNFYLYLVGLVIVLGLQIHFLVSIHIITVFLFYFLNKQKKLLPLFLFLFLVSLPVLLFFVMNYFHILENSSPRIADYFGFLKKGFFSHIWLKNIKGVFDFSYVEPLVFFLLMTFWKQWKTGKWPLSQSMENLLIITVIPCFIGILIARNDWYIFFIPVFLVLLLTKWCDELMPDHHDKKLNYLLICGFIFIFPLFLFGDMTELLSFNNLIDRTSGHYIILLIITLLMFLSIAVQMLSQMWTYKVVGKAAVLFIFLLILGQMKIIKGMKPELLTTGYLSETWPGYQHIQPLMKRILLETNWLPKEAMKRIYMIGISHETSLLSYYSMTKETIANYKELLKEDKARLDSGRFSEKPDGYIIIQHLELFTNYSKKDWEKHLSRSYLLADSIRQEIKKGNIFIKTPTLYDSYWLIPYKAIEGSAFVEGFHNIGQPYYWEEPEWLKNCASTQKFKNKEGFYYCMVLPGHLQRAGIHIEPFEKISNVQHLYLNINIFGPLLGAAYCCSNLDGFALWSDIQINLLCDKMHYRYNASDIGNTWGRGRSVFVRSPLLSPLKLRIPVNRFTAISNASSFLQASSCKKENIKEMEIAFIHSHKKFLTKASAPEEQRIVWSLQN